MIRVLQDRGGAAGAGVHPQFLEKEAPNSKESKLCKCKVWPKWVQIDKEPFPQNFAVPQDWPIDPITQPCPFS